jgi:hypothetical protein
MLGAIPWSGLGAQGDFHTVASATAAVGDTLEAPFTWESTSAIVADVQRWLDAPATNFGWALINAQEGTIRSQKVFYSNEATQDSSRVPDSLNPAWRPTLTVTYEASSLPTGDYNANGIVDAADYVVWRKTLNGPAITAGSGADGNQSGSVDTSDYKYWATRFGNIVNESGSGTTVPEPSTVSRLLAGSLVLFLRRR